MKIFWFPQQSKPADKYPPVHIMSTEPRGIAGPPQQAGLYTRGDWGPGKAHGPG